MELNQQSSSSNNLSAAGLISPPQDGPSCSFSRYGASQSSDSKVRRPEEIFGEYDQIGSELEHSLKAFMSNNLYLSNKLNRLERELQFLKQKRECHRTTLVQLQIKAEKLDQNRQIVVRELLNDKSEKLKFLHKEFNGVIEDDQYLTETQGKIRNLLVDDKNDIDNFFTKVQQEHANQIRFCDEYKQTIELTFKTCYEKVLSDIKEEKNVDLELEEALQLCKNNTGIKEKYEHELLEKYSNLELIENEVNDLRRRVRTCKEDLDEILAGNVKLNEDLTENRISHSAELTDKEKIVETLGLQLQEKVLDLTREESKLQKAMEENKYLLKLVEDVQSQIKMVSVEIEELNFQTDETNKKIVAAIYRLKDLEDKLCELSSIHKLEEQILSRKEVILGKVAAQNSIVAELENKLERIQNEWSQAERKSDDMKMLEENLIQRIESAKKELGELLDGMSEVKVNSRSKLLEQKLGELKSNSLILKEHNEAAENELKSTSMDISSLESEKDAIDQKLAEVLARETNASKKFGYFPDERSRLEELKSKTKAIKEEVDRIKSSMESRVSADHLRDEVAKIHREIEEKKQQDESRKESIQESFTIFFRNLQAQRDELHEASEEEMKRKQSRVDRLQNSISQLQQEMRSSTNELIETTGKNIIMMKERIKVIRRLIESYRVLQDYSQNSKGKDFTVVRLLGTIEEHLASSFRGMIEYIEMTPADLTSPNYTVYKRILDSFERRFNKMTLEGAEKPADPSPTFLAELKLASFCLFGFRRYSEVAFSDSTLFSPASSSVHDF